MAKTPKMRYGLALDLGSTSLGWAMIRLHADNPPAPVAVIKAGVRIFSDGRNPKSACGQQWFDPNWSSKRRHRKPRGQTNRE